MPITILPPVPSGVGPGLLVQLQSNFVGPLPTGSTWVLNITPQGSESAYMVTGTAVTQFLTGDPQIGLPFQGWEWGYPGRGTAQPGAPVTIAVTLNEPGNPVPIDSGAITVPWDPSTGLPALLQEQGKGGLTDVQAEQLAAVNAEIAPVLSLDGLTLSSLTGGVPVDFVAAQLPNAVFGVIVRLTQIPDELRTIEADVNYWRMTLAAVHIYRGTDLWLRFPIHTSNRMCPLPQEGLATTVAENELTAWLLQMSIQVTFAPGVLGEVLLMEYP